eukprot:COSAG05_NODE_225_length_13597_cov_18.878723_15_plen_100_part_00
MMMMTCCCRRRGRGVPSSRPHHAPARSSVVRALPGPRATLLMARRGYHEFTTRGEGGSTTGKARGRAPRRAPAAAGRMLMAVLVRRSASCACPVDQVLT